MSGSPYSGRPVVSDDGTVSKLGQTPRRPAAKPTQPSAKMRSIMGADPSGNACGVRPAQRPVPRKLTPKAPPHSRASTPQAFSQSNQTSRQAGYEYNYKNGYTPVKSRQTATPGKYERDTQARHITFPYRTEQRPPNRPTAVEKGRVANASPLHNAPPSAQRRIPSSAQYSGVQRTAYPSRRTPVGAKPGQRTADGAKHSTNGSANPTRAGQKNGTRGNRQNQTSDNWIIPEGSPIYTAQGRSYETTRDYSHGRNATTKNTVSHGKKTKKNGNTKRAIFYGLKLFATRLLIMLIICSLCTFWWYRAQFYSKNGGFSDDVRFSYALEDGTVLSFTAPAASAYSHGTLYVDFSTVSQWFGMAEVGSIDSMRYVITSPDNRTSSGSGYEEYIIFTNGSAGASVNGSSVIMSGACRALGSHVWVPLSFIENYITGISAEHSSRRSVTFVRDTDPGTDKENAEGTDTEGAASVSLRLKRAAPLTLPEMPESGGDTAK